MKLNLKITVLTAVILLSLSVAVFAMPDLQTLDGPHFITDDTFSMIMTYENSPIISGWDTDVSGGTIVSSQAEEWFRIKDTSTVAPVVMSKKLTETKDCSVTLETSVKMASSSSQSYLKLCGGENTEEFLRIYLENGKFNLKTKTGFDSAGEYVLNRFYGVKFEIDLAAKKYTAYIDGIYVGNFDFICDVNSLNFVEIGTGIKQTAELYMNGLKIHTGYALNEQFFAATDGRIAEDWNIHSKSGSSASRVKNANAAAWPDYYCAELVDNSAVDFASIDRTFDKLTTRAGLEFKFCVEEDNQNFEINWTNENKNAFSFVSKGNALYLNGAKIYDYIKNVWYIISVDADFGSQTADIYINNRIIASNVKFSAQSADGFEAKTGITRHARLYLDDIWAYEVNEPETYVPEPIASPSDDFLIGMQTCDMWRDGQHLGWDYAITQPERIPYLGTYDDGSREAADWDTKWMLENGIDYRLTCWFTPRNYSGGPIKMGSNAYGLLEGVMRSEYSDRMKYAILWENAGNSKTTVEHFKKYIVPYWIEYFIKDPRYLVVDNKPVVYLYLADYFFKNQCASDEETAREAIEYLRNECKKLGFDGCTVIASRSSYSEEYAAKIGCDGIYNYSFAISEAARGAKEANLEKAKTDNPDIFVQPSISMGREESAWLRNPGKYSTVEDFEAALSYVHNDFYKDYNNYTLSEKSVIIATWNEYCEGHYTAPCNLAGFGYLDAVRKVFTDVKEYIPQLPTEEEKDKFSILFPKNREPGMRGKTISVRVPDKVKKAWQGDALSSWTLGKQIDGFSSGGGKIKGIANGMDPSVVSEDNLGINIDNVTYIRLKIKQDVTKKELSIYFIRDDDTKWNEAKGVTLTPENAADGYYEALIPVWSRESWKGTLKQLRIDPLNTTGAFEIESIELLEGDPMDILRIALDGELCPLVKSVASAGATTQAIPIMLDDKFYMPLSCFERYFGLKMVYAQAQQSLCAATKTALLKIDVNSGNATLNEKAIGKIPVKLYEGQYVAPLRETLEALGYSVSWDDESKITYVESPKETEIEENKEPEGTWNFNVDDDLCGWTPARTISSISVMNGIMSLTSNSTDPQINIKGLKLDSAKYTVLKLRLKNMTRSTLAELFFVTDKDATMNAAKSIKIPIEANSSDFVEYEADITNELWKDTVTQLRFDPMTAVGDMQIDYIILANE